MRFQIEHSSRYDFDRPVSLSQHLLRFQPRSAGAQEVHQFELEVDPAPAGTTHHIDADGNAVTRVWFREPSDFLAIHMKSEVSVYRSNPYDFLLNDKNRTLPVEYLHNVGRILAPAFAREFVPSDDDPVGELAKSIADEVDQQLPRFLAMLAQRISADWTAIRRETGEPWRPEHTFQEKLGACRDLTVMYMDACRVVGLASRFVSGYQQGTVDQDRRDLHAWAEVYIPGAGWRGFDPTSGLAVADRHVAIAASVVPSGASCVDGRFQNAADDGSTVGSTLTATIEIDCKQQASA